jgi:hypothetical protein
MAPGAPGLEVQFGGTIEAREPDSDSDSDSAGADDNDADDNDADDNDADDNDADTDDDSAAAPAHHAPRIRHRHRVRHGGHGDCDD